jgi:hypothetical protein
MAFGGRLVDFLKTEQQVKKLIRRMPRTGVGAPTRFEIGEVVE